MLTTANGIRQLSHGEYTVSRKKAENLPEMASKLATVVAQHFPIPATAKLVALLCSDHKLTTKATQPKTQLLAVFKAIVSRKLDLTPDELCISIEKLV